MDNNGTSNLDDELAALVGGDTPEERWRARPEQAEFGGVQAFVLYHLNATTDDDFAGEFGVLVGVSGVAHGEEDHPLPVHRVVIGVEGSTGRRLNNVLFDATEARQLAAQLMDAASEVDKLHDEKWTPEAKGRYREALLSGLTDEQLRAGGLTEDEIREVREINPD